MNTGKNAHEPERVTLLVSIVRDVTSVSILGLILMVVHYFATPFHRGFNCGDETIRYPYKGSTVEAWLLHLVGALINIFIIVFYEYVALRNQNRRQQQKYPASDGANDTTHPQDFKWRIYLCNVYCRLLILIFGMIISEFITELTKFSIGRLRPHFYEICQPFLNIDGEWQNATTYCTAHADTSYVYHTNYECRGPMASKLERGSRLSFMSGHSSYAAFCAAYAIIYLQSMMDESILGLVKPSLQTILAVAALYTGLSRVSDYKHHWQDVLAGLTQGTLVAIIISRYVYPSFKQSYLKYNKVTARRSYDREMESGEEMNHVY